MGGGAFSSLDGDACQVILPLSKCFAETSWIITEAAGSKDVKDGFLVLRISVTSATDRQNRWYSTRDFVARPAPTRARLVISS